MSDGTFELQESIVTANYGERIDLDWLIEQLTEFRDTAPGTDKHVYLDTEANYGDSYDAILSLCSTHPRTAEMIEAEKQGELNAAALAEAEEKQLLKELKAKYETGAEQ